MNLAAFLFYAGIIGCLLVRCLFLRYVKKVVKRSFEEIGVKELSSDSKKGGFQQFYCEEIENNDR